MATVIEADSAFSFEVHGISVQVCSDCPRTLHELNRYLLPWLPRRQRRRGRGALVFRVDRLSDSNHYRLDLNTRQIHARLEPDGILPVIQREIDDALTERLDGYALVHAGVVVLGSALIVLPGESRVGKTTLVKQFISRGAVYGSDEYAPIDTAGRVHPWPRPLMVRGNSFQQRPVLASDIGAAILRGSARVDHLFFLRYEPGSGFSLKRLSAGDAVIRLLQNTPHTLARNPGIVSSFAAAAAGAAAFEGTRGDASETVEQVSRLVQK